MTSAIEDGVEEADEALFRAYLGGEHAAFATLYQRYRQSLFLYLLRSLGSHSEAEDLYHDCWSRVLQSDAPFQDGLFRAYLFKIARNLTIDHQRKRSLRLVRAEDQLAGEATAPSADRVQAGVDCEEMMRQAIQQLPTEQRDTFLLKEESGLSLEQIATLMASGRETIKSRLRYAMQRLRTVLEECL
ncbi:MAG: sigma-70 family RNA polymerase sigma factor [Gammaproteobacteria bacterium]|nr:sigma-70 family RNA polymerase sigma factor [Gammaproteobacteria bacterium]